MKKLLFSIALQRYFSEGMKITQTPLSKLPQLDLDNLNFGEVFTDHMFIAHFDGESWNEGEIVPFGPIPMSPSLSTLHYGQQIFEGFKAYRNQQEDLVVFRPDQNLKRLNRSAKRMAMASVPEQLFFNGLQQLLRLDEDWVPNREGYSLYIRPFLFATDETLKANPSKRYSFVIIMCPVGPYYSKPLSVKVERHYTRAAKGGIGAAKAAGNYASSFFPTQLAMHEGFDQILWTDGINHDHIEELGTSNFFLIRNGEVYTPGKDGNILEGITRASLIEVAKNKGLQVHEVTLEVSDLIRWFKNNEVTECFATGTAAVVTPIASIQIDNELYSPTGATSYGLKLKSSLFDLILNEENHPWIWQLNHHV